VADALKVTSTGPAVASAGEVQSGHAKLFLSYSRKDRSFVDRLSETLIASGQDVWVDLQDIRPSEDWVNAIYSSIERADAFVFVVSPDSVDPTSVCVQEIDHAAAHNKRIIPIVCRNVDTRTIRVPETIGKLNWVSFLDPDGFELSVEKLVSAVETDLEWVKQHTRFLERAVEWDAAKRDDSFLLHKNDLAAGEKWLVLGPTKDPKPTALQTQYIIASRAMATKRQRTIYFIGVTVALLIGASGAWAYLQSKQAEEQHKEASSRALAAEAQFERGHRIDRAILLSAKALSTRAVYEAFDSTVSVGQTTFDVLRILRGHTKRVTGICFLAGSRLLVSAADDGRTILWDPESGSPLEVFSLSADDLPKAIACAPADPVIAMGTTDGKLTLWNIDGKRANPLPVDKDADGFSRLQFSANGAFLVSGSLGGTANVRSGSTGKIVDSTVHFKDGINAVAMSHSGEFVAVGTWGSDDQGGEVSVWSRDGKSKGFSDSPFAMGVGSVVIQGETRKVIAVDIEGNIKAWNTDGSKAKIELVMNMLTGADAPVSTFDLKGERIAVAQGRAAVIGPLDQFESPVQRLAGHAGPVSAVSFSPDGLLVATGGDDGNVIVHRVRGSNEPERGWVVAGPDDSSEDVAFAPDGDALILGGESSKSPRLVQVPSQSMSGLDPGSAVADSPANGASRVPRQRGARLLSVLIENEKAILKDQYRDLAEMIPEPGESVVAGAATMDGRRWVGATANVVRIATTGEDHSLRSILPTGFGSISAVALSPDGQLIAVAGSDLQQALAFQAGMGSKKIVILDAESGRPIGDAFDALDPAQTLKLVFSPNGLQLVSVSQSNTAVWIVGPRLWLRRACAVLQVTITPSEWQRRAPGIAYPESCNSDPEIASVLKRFQ
jgi:WD40 repeat protein